MMHSIPVSLRLTLGLVAANLMIFTLFRIVFYQWFSVPDPTVTTPLLTQAFYLGFKFDLRLALLIVLPVFVLALAWQFNAVRSKWFSNLALTYLVVINAAILFLYFVDFGHYDYLRIRADVTMLRFLEDFAISKQMVEESYPLPAIIGGYIVLLLVTGLAFRYLLARAQRSRSTRVYGWRRAGVSLFAALLVGAGIYGKASYYPLRWSDAFFSTNGFISALSSNPVLYFSETLKNRDSQYDIEAARKAYPVMAEYLALADAPADGLKATATVDQLNFFREADSHSPIAADRPNIVLVFLESYGYYKTGLSGNPLDPTPHFDAMARKGILFDRHYVPHGGTARSVFALITGIPDIEMVKTSTRNPMLVEQATVINSFEGYEKYYFLGGSTSWGNIRGLLSGNIPGLTIFGEGSYSSPRQDVWGISDLHLFEEANAVLQQSREPFLAIIQTSGNHRPYTIPDDNRGFVSRDVTTEEVEPYGFRSPGDYNAFRFMDHSLGVFLQELEKTPYAQNTIFVFFGDHGNDRQAKHMFPGEEQLMLTEYHVPLVFYAPGLIKEPMVDSMVASEVDILPTTASLARQSYTNSTFGRDLFDPQFADKRYAFTFNRTRPPQLGLIGEKYYFIMQDGDANRQLYEIHSDTPRKNLATQLPELADELAELAQAYYDSVRYVRYNNSVKPTPAGRQIDGTAR